MSILDQFGRSIPASEIRRLREPEAVPTIAGLRGAFSEHPADGLTPARLAAIHRDAARGNALRYLELAEDIEERDLHYAAVLSTRKRQVAQLPVTVEAASDDAEHVRHADLVREWLATGALDAALFDILDAAGKGFSVMELVWQTEPGRIWPAELHYRPQRWFEVADGVASGAVEGAVIGETILLREGATLAPLMPHKFLVHRHPTKSGLVMRSGLARLASWAWMWKAFTMRDWAAFVQNYGAPMRLGRYGPESTAEDRRVLWRAVANIAGDCAAIIPKGMEVEFVEVGDLKAGAELYERRCDWLDRQVSKAVLGQTTTTDAVSGGHAVAREHRLVQEDIERSDARMVSASLTRQVVRAMVAFNFGPQDRYPRLLIGRPDELPIGAVVDAVAKLVPVGLRVQASELRDRLGLSEPDEGAELLERARPAPPPASPQQAPAPAPIAANARLPAALQTGTLVDRLTRRVAEDAAGALGGLTAEVRAEIEAATDMPDLARRVAALQLDPAQLALALGRGLAIAHLAGQAALLDEIGQGGSQG